MVFVERTSEQMEERQRALESFERRLKEDPDYLEKFLAATEIDREMGHEELAQALETIYRLHGCQKELPKTVLEVVERAYQDTQKAQREYSRPMMDDEIPDFTTIDYIPYLRSSRPENEPFEGAQYYVLHDHAHQYIYEFGLEEPKPISEEEAREQLKCSGPFQMVMAGLALPFVGLEWHGEKETLKMLGFMVALAPVVFAKGVYDSLLPEKKRIKNCIDDNREAEKNLREHRFQEYKKGWDEVFAFYRRSEP
ncbi:hypothetical protein HYS49_00760 [Candidatus Woesearchaeota archaeon]|nr:hypothetical protein [Candidatus Woesearchaeota archaeon]